MSAKRKTALQRMDALVWWSDVANKVHRDMSRDASRRRHQTMRWLPLVPITSGAALIYFATASPLPHMLYGVAGLIMAGAAAIAINGPLSKPPIDDDEREAALRKNAFLFCLALLGILNIAGGPILLLTAALRGWAPERIVGVAFALFIGNMTWFVSLPTLYA